MHRLSAALLMIPVLTLALWAQDEAGKAKDKDKKKVVPAKRMAMKLPTAEREEGKATKAEQAYDALVEAFNTASEDAKPADVKGVYSEYTKKFLDHAKANAKDATAVESLINVLMLNRADKSKDGPAAEATKLLAKEQVKSPGITSHLRRLTQMGDETLEVVKAVAREHPEKKTRALAFRALISSRNRDVRMAEALGKNEKMKATYEKAMGKEKVAAMIENAPVYQREVKAYRDVLTKGELKGVLPDLSIGALAPETVAVDLKGEKVKLSDLKGKVVVLDFWATWCGPCRAMIPESRELVKEMKGRPFNLVAVSVDEKRETVETFLKKTEMPWTHWWIGRKGKQLELWDVEGFPTVYVIDHKGVIRYFQLGYNKNGQIAKEVEKLVEEAEADAKRKTN